MMCKPCARIEVLTMYPDWTPSGGEGRGARGERRAQYSDRRGSGVNGGGALQSGVRQTSSTGSGGSTRFENPALLRVVRLMWAW
jgi:hypothetical protein